MIVAGAGGERRALAEGPMQANAPKATATSTATPTATQKAKQHYLRGEAYFKAHAFSAAMGEYLSGYEEKPDPVFIFNVAQCQRLLGHPGPALQSYRRYLNESPEGAGRSIAEKQVAELERLLAGSDKPGTSATADAFGPAEPASVAAAGPSRPSGQPAAPAPAGLDAPPASPAAPAPPGPAVLLVTSAGAPISAPTSAPRTDRSDLLSMRTEAEPRPIFKRWWFWTAAGAVSLFALVAIASSSSRPDCEMGRLCR